MHIKQVMAAGALPLLAIASPAVGPRQAATKITVYPAQKYQSIDGFGFSEAFQSDNGIVNLPEPKRTEVIDLLFNTTTGVGFSIVRNGIGSSPDSSSDYMNTILPKAPSGPNVAPNYVWDGKDSGQLWVSQQAVSSVAVAAGRVDGPATDKMFSDAGEGSIG